MSRYTKTYEFDQRTLRRALTLARDHTATVGDAPRYWLIDEVTAVPSWPAVIKSARDDTPFGFDTVVLTGSSAHGLDEARRALGAGRVGPAADPFRLILPMSFREFVQVTGRELPDIEASGPAVRQDSGLAARLAELAYHVDEIDLAWQAYCEIGGFPRAVAEHARDGHVSPAFATAMINWLAPDVTPGDPPESVLRLLSALERNTAAPLNVRRTADVVGMTRERLITRLNRLRTTFATAVCPQVDDDGNAVPGAQSKVYLLDPLLAQLPSLVDASFPAPAMPKVSEAALAMGLARAIESIQSGRLHEGRAVGYARTSSGEIDLAPVPISVGGTRATTPPIESKWVSDGWRPGARAIEDKHGRGFIATKNILDLNHKAWAVPAGMLALLLE